MGMDKKVLDELTDRRRRGRMPGKVHGKKSSKGSDQDLFPKEEQHAARQRLEVLLDPGSFEELGVLARSQHPDLRNRTPADGLVAGFGRINGQIVYVVSEDSTVLAGTRGIVAETKAHRIRQLAVQHRKPFIALMEAGAGRFQEVNGAVSAGLGQRFVDHFELSGHVPQIAAVFGACFGGPSFTGAQSDFVTMVDGQGFMGMSGPPIVKVGIGLDVTNEEIGSADISGRVTGQADHVGGSEEECLLAIRTFLSYLPPSSDDLPPACAVVPAPCDSPEGQNKIDAFVPENHRRAYSMTRLLQMMADGGEIFQYREKFGPNLITAWARFGGMSVGLVANNPMHLSGVLNHEAAIKARRFVELCDAFHIPVISFCDCPGFLVGPQVERQRGVSRASRMLNAMIGLSVPRVTVVVRKAIGLAYIAMGGKVMKPDAIVGWPTAFFDAMGPAAGVELVHGRALANASDPDSLRKSLLNSVMAEGKGYLAAERAIIDDIIKPSETRGYIIKVLQQAIGRQKPGFKHRIDP